MQSVKQKSVKLSVSHYLAARVVAGNGHLRRRPLVAGVAVLLSYQIRQSQSRMSVGRSAHRSDLLVHHVLLRR